jgi:hypothetical protein
LLIGNKEEDIIVDVKIYGFGVVTIRLSIPLRGNLEDLVNKSGQFVGNETLKKCAVEQLKETVGIIYGTIVKPQEKAENEWEDYYIFWVNETEEEENAEDIMKNWKDTIAHILRSEKTMSKSEIEDSLKYPLSYYGNDLTLIDWNASFIYDPTKSYDIPDVIEFAVIQLLELRLYDSYLDVAIARAYSEVGETLFKKFLPISLTLNKLSQIKLDISEMVDRLENYLKLIGDLYLAKIYGAASSRFYLDRWKSAVREKLNVIETLYSKTWERSQTSKMVIFEIAVIILFIIDVIILILVGIPK